MATAVSKSINCPKCRLTNPIGSEQCDCGYNFVTQEVNHLKDASEPFHLGDFLGLLIAGWLYGIPVYFSYKKEQPRRASSLFRLWCIAAVVKLALIGVIAVISNLKK